MTPEQKAKELAKQWFKDNRKSLQITAPKYSWKSLGESAQKCWIDYATKLLKQEE